MYLLSSLMFIIISMAMVVIFIASILSKKNIMDREKSSPFECGFDPFSNSRIPFSIRFFMITIIFLIFDVEIAIILPLPLSIFMVNSIVWFQIMIIFMITLIIGLLHEWNFGSLDWSA